MAQDLAAAGFTPEEIAEYQKLQSAGFSDQEITDYYAKKAPTPAPEKGFLESVGIPKSIAGVADQVGQGILRGATELPGLPADAVTWGLNKIGRNTGLWNEREADGPLNSSSIRGALGPEGLGLIPNLEAQNGVERFAGSVGQGIGGAAVAGPSGLMGLLGGAGGGAGSFAGAEMFPESDIAPIIGGLLGGVAGGYAGAKAPARTPVPSRADIEAAAAMGKPAPKPTVEPSGHPLLKDKFPEAFPVPKKPRARPVPKGIKAVSEKAEGLLGQLKVVDEARTQSPKKAAETLSPMKADAPNSMLGLNPTKQNSINEIIARIEKTNPSASQAVLKMVAKLAAKTSVGVNLGKTLSVYTQAKKFIDLIRNDFRDPKLDAALDDLEYVLKSDQPLPTKMQGMKGGLMEMLGGEK